MHTHSTDDPTKPLDAAAVILIRERAVSGEAEVFLLRRRSGASFMARSFVFPGGTADPGDQDLEETALRELFEEAGVLLGHGVVASTTRAGWRRKVRDGASLVELTASAGLQLATETLHYFAHWITPSIEKKRFSARFFIGDLPPGQTPSFDNRETVDQVWVSPEEALLRASELRLPPPQLRTMYDLREAAARGPSAVLELSQERARHRHPIMPRVMEVAGDPPRLALVLPWDPDYATATGEGIEMPRDHPLAQGPSRLILGDDGWQIVDVE
jgi:8-oxo-dGTP pyrophosphatase MutT (NUDIX family)